MNTFSRKKEKQDLLQKMKNLKEIKKLKIAMLEQNFKTANLDNQWLKNNDGALFTGE